MEKVLFLPLNTNHVLIFKEVWQSLDCQYEILCHDNISEAKQYRTETLLKELGVQFRFFAKAVNRSEGDNFFLKIVAFLKMKQSIIQSLKEVSPNIVVLGIDHDPIAQVVIGESNRLGYKTILFQEGLITPHQKLSHKSQLSDYGYNILKLCGIYLNYSKYGSGDWDKILVGGKRPYTILNKIRGIAEERIGIVGIPKYDIFFQRIKDLKQISDEKKTYLYAARPTIISDEPNIRFLKKLVGAVNDLKIHFIIKLHPRSPLEPDDIYNVIKSEDKSSVEIIKQGDDTFEILKKSYALITDFSTVALEALIMGKECVAASYLAGDNRFEYNEYDAIYVVENESEIYDVMKKSMLTKKSYENKKRLLEDELYRLDGKAGERAASFIENMVV